MRAFWVLFGGATQVLFLILVVALFRFLWGPGQNIATDPANGGTQAIYSGAVDLILLVQFAAFHSLLLHPSMRRRLERWIPSPQYGCFFCAATCVQLLATAALWRPIGPIVLQAPAWCVGAIRVAYISSWIALLASIRLTGLGYQTGFTPWWAWVRGHRPARRGFEIRGAYRIFRHPIYLSFLGLIWFTPIVAVDRLLLDVVWTIYIVLGSGWKDQRLAFYLGRSYRRYCELAPAYPTPRSVAHFLRGRFAVARGPIEVLFAEDDRKIASQSISRAQDPIQVRRAA